MSRLPPPPPFTLPPPPMPPADLFDTNIVSQLTCSSIRQHYQQTMISSRLILIASATVLAAIILFIITLIWLLSFRKQKPLDQKSKSLQRRPMPIDSINDWSTYSSRSYETVSSDHTGIYLESVDTSATTCSTDATSVICTECIRQHGLQPAPYYHILNIPDVVPN